MLFLLSNTFVLGEYPRPPDPSVLPIPPEAYLHGSTIILTQRALQLAPSIFHKFIDDGVQYIRNELSHLSDKNQPRDCCDSFPSKFHDEDFFVQLSRARTNLEVVGDPVLTIADANYLQIDAIVHINVIVPVYLRVYTCIIPIPPFKLCLHSTICSSGDQIWLDATLHTHIRIEVQNKDNDVLFLPVVTFEYLKYPSIGGCECGLLCKFLAFLANIDKSYIFKQAKEEIEKNIRTRMQPISAGDVYPPYYGIAIRYKMVSAILRTNQDIRAYVSIVVYVLNPITQQWLIYQDYDQERSALYPPFDWPSPGLSQPLASLRVGSNVMNAISSAFESLNTFKTDVNDIIEDVFFDEQIRWYTFNISILGQDEALLHVGYISANITCQYNRFNCSNSPFDNSSTSCNISADDIQKHAVPFLSGTITNMDANIVMLMTSVDNCSGVYLNGTSINSDRLNITVQAAPFPIPNSAEEALLKHTIVRSLPIINSLLRKNPLLLPDEAIPYFPNPTSHLFPQVNKQGENVGYGYIDIASNEINSSLHQHELFSHINNTRITTTMHTTKVESVEPYITNVVSLGGIYLSIFESKYDDFIQNTNCSIVQEGFQMSSYKLPTTTYINSTACNNTCTVIAQCMNIFSNDNLNPQYYSLLQDSTTGSILALSFMCSGPQCQNCQYQHNFSKEDNPVETCLLGKYLYRFNQTFSFRITVWNETTIQTCIVKTNPTTTIIPQLDFQHVKAKTTFLFTYTNADQCEWNITFDEPNQLSQIVNLGSTLIAKSNINCSICNSDLSPSTTCAAPPIETTSHEDCYALKAFCMNNCTMCSFDMDLVCLNMCLFTNSTEPIIRYTLLSIEGIWNSNCCLNANCKQTSSGDGTHKIFYIVPPTLIVCLIIVFTIGCLLKKKLKRAGPASTPEHIPLLSRNQDTILSSTLEKSCLSIIAWIRNIPQRGNQLFQIIRLWFIETFQKPTKNDISIHNFIFFCCTIVNIAMLAFLAVSWKNSSPLNAALDSTVDEERYGLTDKYLDNSKAIKDFTNWQSNGTTITIVCTILTLSTFIKLFISDRKKKRFQRILSYILSLILLSQLCLLLVPPFVYNFFQTMNIRESQDTFIQRDSDTRNMLDNVVGGIFAQYVYLLVQSMELYSIQSIRTGIIIGYILYLLLTRRRLANYIPYDGNRLKAINFLNPTCKTAISYINTYISCMRLLICMVELINLIGCLLPAVLIYQISQNHLTWLLTWAASKGVPFLLFCFMPGKIESKFFRCRLYATLFFYIILLAVGTYSLVCTHEDLLAFGWQYPTFLTTFITTITLQATLSALDSISVEIDDMMLIRTNSSNRYDRFLICTGEWIEYLAKFCLKFITLIFFRVPYCLLRCLTTRRFGPKTKEVKHNWISCFCRKIKGKHYVYSAQL